MNRVEILTLDEKDQAVEALMALHAEINRFILGLMLFDFITGKQFLSGDLEEYSTENQEMRKIALLEAGCSDTLATTIMNCGSFKKIDVPSSENISLVRRDKFCGYFMETFEGSYFKIAGKIKNIPLRQKNEMAKSLLSSLYIIHKHGYILGDMKLSNMLYSLNGPTARLVLSDYGGLINFKEMLEKPSLDLLKAAVKSWAPNSSLFHEYHLLQNKFDELYEDSSNLSKEEVRARLEEIYRLIHQLERFAVGEALAYLFVKELPYKTVDINTLHVDYRYRKNFCHKLDENTYDTFRIPEAPRKMEKLILGLLNPDPLKRPSFEEIGSYISSK